MANSITLVLPLIVICCLFFPPLTSCDTDLQALLAFKSAIDVDPNGALNTWNQTLPFCSWNGVNCLRDRVVAINLESQGLVGSLSPHLGNLSLLRTVILQNNAFHGPIPTEIGLLTRIETIDFSNNSFSGAIPKNISGCVNLLRLTLDDNELSGNVPTELGSLSKLQVLELSKNNFSGSIPSSIGNLTSLLKLSVAECQLSGEIPESLALIRGLEVLQLRTNGLTGTVPSDLFNISTIYSFSVSQNELEGTIPPTIGLTLPNLTILNLWMNQFTGPVPPSISNATNLEILNFYGNNLTGRMPEVAGLTRLRSFIVGSNLLEGDIGFISALTNSTNLDILQVSNNLFTGSLPQSIVNLTVRLRVLTTAMNDIDGNIPSDIGNLIGLNSLFFYGSNIGGPIPEGIGKLLNLNWFDVQVTKLTEELPSSLGNLTSLNRLYLNDNSFSGNIPSSLGNYKDLQELDMSGNNFSGLIPPEIMKLSSVTVIFNLSNNNLEGSIPYEVGSLRNLVALDLSNNRLSGEIPKSISDCMSLEQLYLEGNLLEGEIPLALSDLMGLQDLDLSGNNFSGPIPDFLGKLDLQKLNLSFNKLDGEVPVLGVFKNRTLISLEGNGGLCGGIGELNLPTCPSGKPRKRNFSTLLKILIPSLVAGGICLLVLVFLNYKKRMSRRNQVSYLSAAIGIQFMRLSYADLLKATDGFSASNLVGVGRFGSVYKGTLEDGEAVIAVKVLNLVVRGASKSFLAECNALRSIRHRNLVKILSICESIDFQGNDFKALVYEFKANGSLDKWLYHDRGEEEKEELGEEIRNLTMIQRLNIAIDIAKAIEYLHSGTESAIIHGDLKPSNILLDDHMTASVGDFGLAKIVSDKSPSLDSSISIGIRGTIGYVPPEYGTSHAVSTQGDVYSFGIVLLEMFTSKRPTDDSFKEHINLHNFVDAALPDRVGEIVDPELMVLEKDDGRMEDCMRSILSIGVWCSKDMASDRLAMADVVNQLHDVGKKLSDSRTEL